MKKKNWTLILGIPGALAALVSILTFVISKDFRCSITHLSGIKSDQCGDNAFPPNIKLLISNETGEPIENAEVDFIGNDTPEQEYTDKNGFVQARIKNEGSLIVRIRTKNYPIEEITINSSTQQVNIREIRLSSSGTPTVKDLNPTSTPVPTPTFSPTPTPTLPSSTNPISTNPAPAVLPVSEVLNGTTFQLDSCTRKPDSIVSCHFTLTASQDASYDLSLSNSTEIVDGLNNPYYVNKGYIGKVTAGFNNSLQLNMVKDAHSNVIIDFTGVPTSVSQAFLVNLSIPGWTNVQFRNIPIK